MMGSEIMAVADILYVRGLKSYICYSTDLVKILG